MQNRRALSMNVHGQLSSNVPLHQIHQEPPVEEMCFPDLNMQLKK